MDTMFSEEHGLVEFQRNGSVAIHLHRVRVEPRLARRAPILGAGRGHWGGGGVQEPRQGVQRHLVHRLRGRGRGGGRACAVQVAGPPHGGAGRAVQAAGAPPPATRVVVECPVLGELSPAQVRMQTNANNYLLLTCRGPSA